MEQVYELKTHKLLLYVVCGLLCPSTPLQVPSRPQNAAQRSTVCDYATIDLDLCLDNKGADAEYALHDETKQPDEAFRARSTGVTHHFFFQDFHFQYYSGVFSNWSISPHLLHEAGST